MKGNLLFGLGVILVMIVVGISMISQFYQDGELEYPPLRQCKNLCSEYNAEFSTYDSGGFGQDECWCKRNNEPLRVS